MTGIFQALRDFGSHVLETFSSRCDFLAALENPATGDMCYFCRSRKYPTYVVNSIALETVQ